MDIYNPNTLPLNDNINPYAYCVDVTREYIVRKGKMIAYYGNLRFEQVGSSIVDILVQQSFNAPAYGGEYIIVTGRGKLILGDDGHNINSYDLENANMTIKARNLLGFEPTLSCQECFTPGYLTLVGTGKILASSNGMVHFMEPPVRVDPEALLGWADCPTPAFYFDHAYIKNALSMGASLMGMTTTGEEKQLDFTGQGTVIIQSSEKTMDDESDLSDLLSGIGRLKRSDLQTLRTAIDQKMQGRDY